jgi:hypothetical protein
MPLVKVCPNCGATDVRAGRPCPWCEPARRARDEARRRAKPQRRVWDSPRWRALRPKIRQRDGDRCRRCRRHHSELEQNEWILVNHVAGLANILAAGGDPFDEDGLELLCSSCSGKEDGGRPTLEGVHGQGSDVPPHPARRPINTFRGAAESAVAERGDVQ